MQLMKNECAANTNDEDYDLAIMIESMQRTAHQWLCFDYGQQGHLALNFKCPKSESDRNILW